MTIIFYDADSDNLYVCSQNEKMRVISLSSTEISSQIPEGDVLWVSDAAYITKSQFIKWLQGDISFDGSTNLKNEKINRFTGFLTRSHVQGSKIGTEFARATLQNANRLYIHPKHNGTIVIPTIKTKKFPEGLELRGKYHFEPLDELPVDLEDNPMFRNLLKKGKVEIVNHEYVLQNAHKNRAMSPSDAATDKILIKDGHAKDVAYAGGIDNYSTNEGEQDGPIEIIVN